jgi:hypothetical protein
LTRREDWPRDAVGVRRPWWPTTSCECRRGPALEQPGTQGPRQKAGGETASGQGSSEHPHLGLRAEHPLLIGGQDQGLFPGHVVRLGADVPLAIEEQHPQQPAGGIKEMHRDDADRAGVAEDGPIGSGRQVPEPTDYGSLQAAVSLDKERGLALLAGRLLLALLELAVPVKVQVLQDLRSAGRNIRAESLSVV